MAGRAVPTEAWQQVPCPHADQPAPLAGSTLRFRARLSRHPTPSTVHPTIPRPPPCMDPQGESNTAQSPSSALGAPHATGPSREHVTLALTSDLESWGSRKRTFKEKDRIESSAS